MKRIYVCENEVTGLFSALYDAWKYLVPDHGASVNPFRHPLIWAGKLSYM